MKAHASARPELCVGTVATLLLAAYLALAAAAPAADARGKAKRAKAQAKGLKLLGMDDLQARSAYQPTIHYHVASNRWIAYIGHHGGTALTR